VYWIFIQKYSQQQSVLAALIVGVSPLFVIASREPANGLMYLPLLLIVIGIIYFKNTYSILIVSILGFLVGIILNFDTVSVLALFPLSIYLYSKSELRNHWYIVFFIILTYIPLLLFEVKNDFVISKGIFINKNYQTFVNNNNVEGAVSGKSNLMANYQLISERVTQQVGLTPFITLLILAFIVFKKIIPSQKERTCC
jgi:hypothetical protein